ncbi:G-type lectin S-receptor-like serine/threonine-protein kinase At4g27290 [Camellia sinensis]|uniref:G-type lectin S-receptor-like serine/threonine-protein kinase At4g27290 n=1 Tax=Camellia sinensis TaxID=4442 RepID=UPI001035DC58|nr:G-type lectin S-receptor-like serine/threonine-protein kinase At4g27290 [Camellia sinensis]
MLFSSESLISVELDARMMKQCLVVVFLPCLGLLVFSCWFFHVGVSNSTDTLVVGQEMREWENISSPNGYFQLGFFSSPSGSTNRYLGIQVTTTPNRNKTVVWLANRDNPVTDSSGVLKITQEGKLMINDSRGIAITLNSEQQRDRHQSSSISTSATLLDSGNFVLRSGEHIMWQSFDYPSDVWLKGMKLGTFNLKSGGKPQHRFLASWSTLEDPDLGGFTLGVDPNNTKQLITWKRSRRVVYWRSGMWNGYNFSLLNKDDFALFNIDFYNSFKFSYFSNENESYFTWNDTDPHYLIWLDSSGALYICDYTFYCNIMVNCDPDQGYLKSGGCVNYSPSNCIGGDGFKETRKSMELDWYLFSSFNLSLDLSDCKEKCRTNCSCQGYASVTPLNGGTSGCAFYQVSVYTWDIQEVLYIRNNNSLAKSESSNNTTLNNRKRHLWLIIGGPIASLLILTSISLLCYLRWKNQSFKGGSNKVGIVQGMQLLMDELNNSVTTIDELSNAGNLMLREKKDRELPFVSFSTIEIATEYFSEKNKIGQGGYGPVYKGQLVNGQEIAVKRLSSSSRQGLEEFKNEVILISRLQHCNLVRLLGCCMQRNERILIYEYLPNNSLDFFLFDVTKQYLLDWKMRVRIIGGIAQGLLYLHKYSRLKIIHRDLKTSNILLDKDMNPKISDFGTARIFCDDENQASTKRIVGTHGYMSPEYAMDGLFSVKSDVFSFGVMMLEIISGKKNTSFCRPDRALNLLGYAWDLWKEGKGLELVDQALVETCSTSEAMRYIQVGFLCVQEIASDRPNMLDIVSMLTTETMVLPTPKQPAFSKIMGVTNVSTPKTLELCSINDVTISEVEVR